MLSQDVRLSVRPCVRLLSHAGIESKRLYITYPQSYCNHQLAAHHSSFPAPNGMAIFRRGPV